MPDSTALSAERLTVVARSHDLPFLQNLQSFAVARKSGGGAASGVFLVPGDGMVDTELRVNDAELVPLPPTATPEQAVLLPPLTAVLALWETLKVELGDVAVITGGHVLAPLAAEVARWRGACPVITLGPEALGDVLATQHIEWSDSEEAGRQLLAAIGDRPGFAALELSGRADMIDLLLESIPKWGRLLLAGSAAQPITVDFYKNIHRKGVTVHTAVLEPASLFKPAAGAAARAQIGHAVRLLQHEATGRRCQALLANRAG